MPPLLTRSKLPGLGWNTLAARDGGVRWQRRSSEKNRPTSVAFAQVRELTAVLGLAGNCQVPSIRRLVYIGSAREQKTGNGIVGSELTEIMALYGVLLTGVVDDPS